MRIPTGSRWHTLFIEGLFTKVWDILGGHKEQRWDPVQVVVDLTSPLGLKSTRGKKGNGSRGERIIDIRLPWEVSGLQSEENSNPRWPYRQKPWGKVTSLSLPLWSPTGAFHWLKLPSSRGTGSRLMNPPGPATRTETRWKREDGRYGGANEEIQLKHFQVPKPSSDYNHLSFHKYTLTAINYIIPVRTNRED